MVPGPIWLTVPWLVVVVVVVVSSIRLSSSASTAGATDSMVIASVPAKVRAKRIGVRIGVSSAVPTTAQREGRVDRILRGPVSGHAPVQPTCRRREEPSPPVRTVRAHERAEHRYIFQGRV